MKIKRQIIRIDAEKCDGCGVCAPACAEGAIEIIDGKARLMSEIYCDGLGACLGECPRGAITMEEREAEPFDEKAVEELLKSKTPEPEPLACGCPGTMATAIEPDEPEAAETGPAPVSRLRNWPVQLHLLPVSAPYFQDAHLLIAADCTPFAYADFHNRFIKGRTVVMGCPKLDDAQAYFEKLTRIFKANDIKSVEVAYMEVPCCSALVNIVEKAVEASGRGVPVTLTRIGIRGGVIEDQCACSGGGELK